MLMKTVLEIVMFVLQEIVLLIPPSVLEIVISVQALVLLITVQLTKIFALPVMIVQVQEQLLTVRLLLLIPKILLEQIPVQVLVNIVQLAETVPL